MEPTAAGAASEAPVRPQVEPAAAVDLIDLEHLARMTLGEAGLEAEVLRLFERQAAMLLAHMRDASPPRPPPSRTRSKAPRVRSALGAWLRRPRPSR